MADATQLAALKTKLADAEDAYHDLVLGTKAVVVVDQNGERVEYQRTSRGGLAAYINELKRQIAECEGKPSLAGPIWVWG